MSKSDPLGLGRVKPPGVKVHYHVSENTPGYLPESEGGTFTNKKVALSYAASLAEELREAGYKVTGARGEYYGELGPCDLGRVIETTPCVTPDCAPPREEEE